MADNMVGDVLGPMSRRRMLRLIGIGAGASLVAACTPAATPAPTAAPAKPAAAPTTAPAAKPAAAPTTAPAAKPAAAPTTAPAAAAKPAGNALAELHEKAKAEKEVHFWGSNPAEEMVEMGKLFTAKYPGVEFKMFDIRNEDLVQRTIAESSQGKVSLDVNDAQITQIYPLIERDLVQGYSDWTTVFPDLKPDALSLDGRLLLVENQAFPIAYNTSLLKPEEVPTAWEDLLDPKWKSRLIIENRGTAFAYLAMDWGEQKTVDFVNQIKQQNPVYVRGGTVTVEQLIAGVAPVAVGTYVHIVDRSKEDGAPVEWAKKVSPMPVTHGSAYTLKGAPHPNAAKLFLGWYAGTEGRAAALKISWKGVFYEGSPHPAMADIKANNIKLLRETPENFEQIAKYRDQMAELLGT